MGILERGGGGWSRKGGVWTPLPTMNLHWQRTGDKSVKFGLAGWTVTIQDFYQLTKIDEASKCLSFCRFAVLGDLVIEVTEGTL